MSQAACICQITSKLLVLVNHIYTECNLNPNPVHCKCPHDMCLHCPKPFPFALHGFRVSSTIAGCSVCIACMCGCAARSAVLVSVQNKSVHVLKEFCPIAQVQS